MYKKITFAIAFTALLILAACTPPQIEKSSNADGADRTISESDVGNYAHQEKDDISKNEDVYLKMDSPSSTIYEVEYLYPVYDREIELYGYINGQGEMIIDPAYEYAGEYRNGVARVSYQREESMLINTLGEVLLEIPPEISFENYSNGMLLARQDNKPGFINWQGEWLCELFDEASSFSEGLAWARKDSELYGYISKEMEWQVAPQFEAANNFSEGLAHVKIDGKYGYINQAGEWVITPQYDSASAFCLGYAAVEIDQQWGVIDGQGAFIIEPAFGTIVLTEDGVANGVMSAHESFMPWLGIGTEFSVGIIDFEGNWITEPIYGSDIPFYDGVGIAAVGISKEMIGLDYEGNVIIEPRYSLTYSGEGIFEYYRDSQYDSWMADYPDTQITSMENIQMESGYLNSEGNIIH